MIKVVNLNENNTSQVLLDQDKEYQVQSIYLNNLYSFDRTVNIYFIPNGGTKGQSTLVYSDLSVQQGNTITLNDKLQLGVGDRIEVELTNSPQGTEYLNVFISYVEI